MPGIISHHRLLVETVAHLARERHLPPPLRSVEILLNTPAFKNAAFFGAIGPNIFDYAPGLTRQLYGSPLSYLMHNGGSVTFIAAMLRRIGALGDLNTEWASVQRAYLHGFIAHAVADIVYHPFMFYWSGFPDAFIRREINHYREQNLVFEYNLDLFFLHQYRTDGYAFNLDDMLPLREGRRGLRINRPVKRLILEAFKEGFPDQYRRLFLGRPSGDVDGDANAFTLLDALPSLIRATYWIKRNRNPRLNALLDALRRRTALFNDYLVRYPDPRRINSHVLNLHRQRWVYPAGARGIHYESVEDLMRVVVDRTVDLWARVEAKLRQGNDNYSDVIRDMRTNNLSGEDGKDYLAMKDKEPVRLRV